MTTNNLLDRVIESLSLKNDAALSRALGLSPPVLSKLRHGKLQIGPTTLIRVHELTQWPLAKIRDLAGMPVYVLGGV